MVQNWRRNFAFIQSLISMDRSIEAMSTLDNSVISSNFSSYNNSDAYQHESQYFADLEGESYLLENQSFEIDKFQIEMQPRQQFQRSQANFFRGVQPHSLDTRQRRERRSSQMNRNSGSRILNDRNQQQDLIRDTQIVSSQAILRESIQIPNNLDQGFQLHAILFKPIQIGQNRMEQEQNAIKSKNFEQVLKFEKQLKKNCSVQQFALNRLRVFAQKFPQLNENKIYAFCRFYLFLKSKGFLDSVNLIPRSALVLAPFRAKHLVMLDLKQQLRRMSSRKAEELKKKLDQIYKQFTQFNQKDQSVQTFNFQIWLEYFADYLQPGLRFIKHDPIEVHRMAVSLLCKYLPCKNFIAILFLAKVKCYCSENFQFISRLFLRQKTVTKNELLKVEEISKQAKTPLIKFD